MTHDVQLPPLRSQQPIPAEDAIPIASNGHSTVEEEASLRIGESTDAAEQNRLFGAWLREQLQERGVTQVELARRIGKTYVHVRRIISGVTGTKRSTVLAIAEALDLPATTAIQAAFGPFGEEHEEPSWMHYYYELPPDERREIDDYVEYRYHRWHAMQEEASGEGVE
jgi:transcriptional regulator with XRE-family HTH domain